MYEYLYYLYGNWGGTRTLCVIATTTVCVLHRMIEQCLRSSFTQFNFFLHNLAQMKFSGHSEGALLSFSPKTYSIDTDGRITHIELAGYQKRYNPEKYYVSLLEFMSWS